MKVDFFKTWSPDMAWLLGYIWADGSIGHYNTWRLQFGCRLADREVLDRIHVMLGCHQNICVHKEKYVFLSLSCKPIVVDLMELHGLVFRKSGKNVKFPRVPDKYFCHFTRGYLDGDGCVSFVGRHRNVQVELYGTQKFIVGLRDGICFQLNIRVSEVKYYRNNIWRVIWGAQGDVYKLYKWLYSNGYVCLERKRKRMSRVEITKVPLITGRTSKDRFVYRRVVA